MSNEKTLSQTIADQLAEEIILRRILPGTKMDEQKIADRFGVSRSPVRDALRQLAITRLINYIPRKGFSVAAIKSSELDQLFEASAEIEAMCAKLCALRASPSERKRLEHIHNEANKAAKQHNSKDYSALNDELHRLVYSASHNKVLESLAIEMRQRLTPFRAQGFFTSDNRIDKSNQEHDQLVSAIVSQNAERAAKAMYSHATNSAMNVLQHFEE